MDRNVDPVTMLKMRSDDGGVTWPSELRNQLPVGSMLPPQADPDPDLIWDPWGNLFLTYCADSGGARVLALYVSNDAGTTWTAVSGLEGITVLATPKLALSPLLGTSLARSLWLSYSGSGSTAGAWAAGIEVRGTGTSNIGPDWTGPALLPDSSSSWFTSVTIGPAGEVAVSHVSNDLQIPPTVRMAVNETGLGSTDFADRASFDLKVATEGFPPNGGLEMVPIPYLDWDRPRNRLYIVYPDRPSATSGNDMDIYVRYSTDKAVSWVPATSSNGHRVNTGAAGRTEFHPRLVVNQSNGFVGVIWYDCRNDSENKRPHVFAAVSTDGFETAQPRNFQFNPAWSDNGTANHSYKEYIGLRYASGFLYPAWLDNSNYKGDAPSPTNQFEIYTGRIPF